MPPTNRPSAARTAQRLLQGNLPANVALLGAGIAAKLVSQHVGQDLPQPGQQLGLGAAAKMGQVAAGLQERLLHDIRGVELAPVAAADLGPCQNVQPRLIACEDFGPSLSVAAAQYQKQLRQVGARVAHWMWENESHAGALGFLLNLARIQFTLHQTNRTNHQTITICSRIPRTIRHSFMETAHQLLQS